MAATPVNIAEVVFHGVALDPKNRGRVSRMDLNELYASVGRLFELLEERRIDYVLAGGVAMLSYVEGRNTQDIDLVISRDDLERLPELRIEDQNPQFGRSWFGELQVDLLFADRQPFRTVVSEFSGKRAFHDRQVICATETGLLLMKLYALPSLYRQADFNRVTIYEGDIANLLSITGSVPDRVWAVLDESLIESDLVELRRLVSDLMKRRTEDRGRFSDGDRSES